MRSTQLTHLAGIGEDKTNGNDFTAVNCYSSTNLVQWSFVRPLLSLASSGDLGPNRVLERPKIIYNSNSKQYVMYMHIDSATYGEAKVGLATSSSICGSAFSYKGSWLPLGYESRDMGLFKDDDGKAYLLTEDVCCPRSRETITLLTKTDTACQWPPHQCLDIGLPQRQFLNLSLPRRHRIPGRVQKKWRLLHVRLASHRLRPKRQRLLHRIFNIRSLDFFCRVRSFWNQNLLVPDDFHSPRWQ